MVRKANYFPLYEVKICGVRYSVGEVDDLRDESGEKRFYGKISHVHLKMEVEEDMAREVKIQSVIHESLHGLLHHTGNYDIEEEERIVQMLGCQLPQFLRENRALVDLIMGDGSQFPNHITKHFEKSADVANALKCKACGSRVTALTLTHNPTGDIFCSITCFNKREDSAR